MSVKMTFPLPYYLPILIDSTLVSTYEAFATFKFRFVQLDISKDNELGFSNFRTDIIIEFIADRDVSDFSQVKMINYAVVNSIIYLNNFLDGFRLVSNLSSVRNFTITDLPPIIYIKYQEIDIAYITQPTVTEASIDDDHKELVKLTFQTTELWRKYQRFEVIDKFRSKAIHHLHTEDFISAIIELQTSFESYVRMCHHLILVKLYKNDEEIMKASNLPFKNTIQHHLGPLLKEDFDFAINCILSDWNSSLYDLRNNIVHSGHSYISGTQAYAAYDSYQKAVNYITDLMVRENYLDEGKLFKVGDLNKNTSENVDSDKVINKLNKLGILTFLEE